MSKKSRKPQKGQQPSRVSEKKVAKKQKNVVHIPKLEVVIVPGEPEELFGNGGEKLVTPEEMVYIEDTRKPELVGLNQPIPEPAFDAKKLIDDILKKHGA